MVKYDLIGVCTIVCMYVHFVYIAVEPEIMAGIKFGGWALNRQCKNIGGFKFGGSVRDRHTHICKYEILAEFNLAVAS